jgi:hypothetical protein
MADTDYGGETARAVGSPGVWETYLTSAIGADHVRAGTPNQDAVAATKFEFPDAPGMQAFAVADGHGHARHFRSDRGSKFAVAAGVSAARAWADALPPGQPVPQAAASKLVFDVVARWRDMVAADLAADPLTQAQRASLLPDDLAEIPYGATLMLGVLRSDVAVLAQIGDGEVLVVLPDGRHLEPIPGDSRLNGTQTTSLCQLDALSAFRVALVNLAKSPVFAVFAATDGYGNAQAEADWQQGLAADLVRLGSERGIEWIGSQLSTWAAICASSDGSGDDSSVALSLNPAVDLAPPPRRARPSFARAHDDETLPVIRTPETERTLTLPSHHANGSDYPDRPAEPATTPQPTVTATVQPPAGGPVPAGPMPAGAVRSAFAPRPTLLIGGAVAVVIVVVIALVLGLGSNRQSTRSPAFHPNPTPTHRITKPTPSATASPSPSTKASPTAKPTSSPTSGSGLSADAAAAPLPFPGQGK